MKKSADLLSINLRKLMIHHHLVEAELSKRSGVPVITISRLKNAYTEDPRLSTLLRLADFFAVSLHQLIGLEPLYLEADRSKNDNRSTFEVPMLSWEQIVNWNEALSSIIDKEEHLHCVYSDQVSSANAFGLEIISDEYGVLFPKESIVFIDCGLEKSFPYYALIIDKVANNSFIGQMTRIMSKNYLIHPNNQTINIPFDEANHTIVGVVSGMKIYF